MAQTKKVPIIVKHFRVEKVGGKMLAFPDPRGKYRAKSAEQVEAALTNKVVPEGVDVKIGNQWHPIKRTRSYSIRDRRRRY